METRNKLKEVIRTILFFIGYCIYHNKGSKIIYYHDIYRDNRYTYMGTSLDLFKRHLEVLNECGYTIVPEIAQKECEVAIMFDDGFRGLWDCRDFFSERGIKPTVFIAKSLVGKEGYLTESEIVELDRMGWRMQSHTVSHVSLNDFTEDELDYEFIESKRYLESILGHPVTEVCAPLGRISNLVCERGYKAGYTLFYSCMPGNYDEPVIGYKYVLKRNLCQFLSPLQFKLAISGGYKIFQKRYLIRNYKH